MPPGARGSPGRVSSSPVATTATRGLRVTSSCAKSAEASKRDVTRRKPPPALEQNVARSKIETTLANVLTSRGRFFDAHGLATRFDVFLDHDGVRAVRHNAAGKDADRLARGDSATIGAARSALRRPP